MTKLTTERLGQFIANPLGNSLYRTEQMDMARQLLAYEQAAKNPIAFTEACEISNMNATGLYMRGFPDSKQGRNIPIYAAPVLPKQPELPQGFTYGSGILTANFGNGDVLISDTHWPESGHAGISFAPVPQPKRPHLSDYTDLLGGSKTEDVGTLFIVKSNSAESLIAIRNKLDIAINALSLAPAQPVIPEQPDAQDLELYIDMHENSDSDDEDGELNNTQLIVWLKELQRRRSLSAQPVSEPKWISVTDLLPAEFGRYLCYVEEQNDLGKSHYQWNCSWNGDVFSDSSLTGRVTHWMPLPSAPAQESE
ncbi:MAG: DUF551 domain-containing protein [Hafnia alvei]|nr:DUF551 domain-containing protein [Hafnia alvei]